MKQHGKLAATVVAVALCATLAVALELKLKYGWGAVVSATETSQTLTIGQNDTNNTWYARSVSVYNAGTGLVYVAVNCGDTNTFNTYYAAGDAVPVPSGITFQWEDSGELDRYYDVSLVCTAGTATVYVSAK